LAEPFAEHQIAQHQIVVDLPVIAPTIDKIGRFVERRIDEVGRSLEIRSDARALRSIGQIERDMTRTVEFARLSARQRSDFTIFGAAEVPQGGHCP
jgi:hypothetical protein